MCNFSSLFVYRFAAACTYYGISLNIDGFGVNIYLTQFIYGAIEVPAVVFVFFSFDKIGRKLTQAGTQFLTGLCILCNMFIPQGKWAVVKCVSSHISTTRTSPKDLETLQCTVT